MLHEVQDVHEQLLPSITPPSGRCALAVLQLWHKCSRRADSKNAERIPRFERHLVTGIPAPDLIADGLDVVIPSARCRIPACFPAVWARCRWGVRREKLSHTIRHTGKTRRLSSHSWLEYSVRPDNEFELIDRKGSRLA